MDQKHLDEMPQPGWSNRGGAKSDPFKRNPDGTVPADVAPADPSHVASAKAEHRAEPKHESAK